MYQIQEIAFEPVMFSSDKIKISKVDFERLKESVLKAYTQHNLYATVCQKIEGLEKDKEFYKKPPSTPMICPVIYSGACTIFHTIWAISLGVP